MDNDIESSLSLGSNHYFIEPNKLEIGQQLGNGHFGVVKKGNLKISSTEKKPCAVKILLNDYYENKNQFLLEIVRMSMLTDTNIVKLYGYTYGDNGNLIMIMEFCHGGSLEDRLQRKPMLSTDELLSFSIQIARGMDYLHSKNVVHRDLACRNILLTEYDKTVKIADFGLSRFLNDDEKYYFANENSKFPLLWTPPEFWVNQKGKFYRFSTKSDVWSFGVTMWEMFSYGKQPWNGKDRNEIKILIMKKEVLHKPIHCPAQIYSLMKKCWAFDSGDRPDFELIINELIKIEIHIHVQTTISLVKSLLDNGEEKSKILKAFSSAKEFVFNKISKNPKSPLSDNVTLDYETYFNAELDQILVSNNGVCYDQSPDDVSNDITFNKEENDEEIKLRIRKKLSSAKDFIVNKLSNNPRSSLSNNPALEYQARLNAELAKMLVSRNGVCYDIPPDDVSNDITSNKEENDEETILPILKRLSSAKDFIMNKISK